MTGERVLYGVAASPGIGIGHALVYKEKPMGSLERKSPTPSWSWSATTARWRPSATSLR